MADKDVFTDKRIRQWVDDHIASGTTRIEKRDAGAKGLVLRIEPTGRATFVWYYVNTGGQRRVLTLGPWGRHAGQIQVDEARIALRNAKKKHKEGFDPGRSTAIPKTIKELAEDFFENRIKPKRVSHAAAWRVINKDIIEKIGRLQLSDNLTPAHAGIPTKEAVKRGATTHAGKVLSLTKQMFNYAVNQRYIKHSPAATLKSEDAGVQNNERTRKLTIAEISQLWDYLKHSQVTPVVALGLKLLLLLGIRTSELRLAQWKQIDFESRIFTIPIEHQKTRKKIKNPQPLYIPISDYALKLFEELYKITGELTFILCSPVLDPNEPLQPIDERAMAHAVRRMYAELESDETKISHNDIAQPNIKNLVTPREFIQSYDDCNWTPHDFRRNVRTFASKNGFDFVVCEKLLGHSLGKIHNTYDQYDFFNERKEALQLWGEYVRHIVAE